MQLFNLGEQVIDTRTHESVGVVAVIPVGENSITDLYILNKSDGSYYISDDQYLIVYDKYYWDYLEVSHDD